METHSKMLTSSTCLSSLETQCSKTFDFFWKTQKIQPASLSTLKGKPTKLAFFWHTNTQILVCLGLEKV